MLRGLYLCLWLGKQFLHELYNVDVTIACFRPSSLATDTKNTHSDPKVLTAVVSHVITLATVDSQHDLGTVRGTRLWHNDKPTRCRNAGITNRLGIARQLLL